MDDLFDLLWHLLAFVSGDLTSSLFHVEQSSLSSQTLPSSCQERALVVSAPATAMDTTYDR